MVISTAAHKRKEPTGRNPVLNGLRLDIYHFIERNPGCTRKDVASGLKLSSSTATARISELKDDGFIYEPPGETKRNNTGVRAKTLYVTKDNIQGRPRDKVSVNITISVDIEGNYHADAVVVKGVSNDLPKVPIAHKQTTITVMKPQEVKPVFEEGQTVKMSSSQRREDGLTIDADYTILNNDN